MKVVSKALAVALVAAAGLSPVFADGVQDYYLQRYQSNNFDLSQNATSFAVAGSTLATMSDSGSVLANPAGLGWMKNAEVSGAYAREKVSGNDINTFNDVEATTNAGHILGVVPLLPYVDSTPEYGSLGLGWSKVKSNGNDSGDLDLDGYRLHLAYGIDLSPEMTVGYALSYVYTELLSTGSRELRMDDGLKNTLGLQYKLSPETLLGLSTSFGFGKYESKTGTDANFNVNSLNVTTGLAHKLSDTLTGSAGIDYTNYATEIGPDSSAWNFRTGLEQNYGMFQARVGYRYAALFGREKISEFSSTKNDKINAVSFGVGLKLEGGSHIDYAAEYRNSGDGDWTHIVSAAIPFSLCEDV